MKTPRNYELASRGNLGNDPARLLTSAYSIKWGLRLGKVGFIDVVLPARGCSVNPNARGSFVLEDFDQNDWIELHRSYGATGVRTRVGPSPFLLTSVELALQDDGLRVIKLHGETPLGVLSRRINPYDGDDPRSDFPPLTADDFMKNLVRNNFGPNASSHRNAPGYAPDPLRDASSLLSVQANVGAAAPNYEPDVENAEVLRAIQAAADYSWDNNIALFYDVFYVGGAIPFEFRTMTGVYGTDRSAVAPGRVVLHENIDLTSFSVGFDWTGSSNNVYSGGRGQTGNARIYEESPALASADYAALLATVTADPFALRETFDSSSADDTPGIQAAADTARTGANTVFRATGKAVEAGRYAYGLDYTIGDLVGVSAGGIVANAFVTSEVGSLSDKGTERLEIAFNTEPLPRASAQGVAGVLSDLSRITTTLEKLSRLEV
ncbi:MAG: hypothetical protein R2867_05255 [Caldilineaceae bacterium]